MPETFGARLHHRREEQKIALITIAEQTKIKTSLLEALERDDVSQWPSGIFRRAFVRAYARAIGLDADVVVREFLEAHPEPEDIAAPASAITSGADGTRATGGPPTRIREMLDSAIGALSRLRRRPAAAGPAVGEGAPVSAPGSTGLHIAAARHLSRESGRVEVTDGVPANGTGVNVPASLESDLPAAAYSPPEPGPATLTNGGVIAGGAPVHEPASPDPDFLAVAHLCTEFGRVENTDELQPLLQEAARILDARGLIIWVWDGLAAQLRPTLAHGYSHRLLAQLPTVGRDADNPTAAAFRSARTCAISGSADTSGALVVPLLTPAGCSGVLALELPRGSEQARSVRAVATIVAAMLAQLIGGRPAEIRAQAEMIVPPLASRRRF